MRTFPTSRVVIALAFLFLFLFAVFLGTRWQFPQHEQYPNEPGSRVVASIGTRSITLHEIEQTVALPLYQADQQRSQLLHQALQNLIDEELLNTEASRKGVTVSQLVADASQSESIARLADLPGPVTQLSPGKARGSVNPEALRDPQEQARLRQALLVSLRRQANIHINFPAPEPPILPVNADDDPSVGSANAPVTIVEFSDFQCPYCKLSVPLIKEILTKYPGKVKVVYRDYPGPNHPHATQAAEAAQCAGEQGKFWEYHDSLFDHQAPGIGWNFSELAKNIGLNHDVFATCLNSGRYREEVAKDLHDGFKLGVTSTPTFFINGRPLVGAKSFAEFQAVIERLLKQQPLS
ncbi:MAG TPA: thioredoxin domain-containing protein [Nitrospiraceae bacterium]|nr:thioredoxin domain-containing protein [Nitrospiraceae bacterium]